MVRTMALLLITSTMLSPANSDEKTKGELIVVPTVDFHRYCGTWYEIARLPNKFQEDCACNVMATYTLLDDGSIKVVNRCLKADGDTIQAEGKARRKSDDEPLSKLQVRFAPAFLSFLPFVWGDYWIIDLATDYTYAVIGEPDRKYLWILARSPRMDDALYQEILGRITAQGYDVSKIIRTPQKTQ